MTDIIKLAREAGATPYTNRHYPDRPTHTFNVDQLERFAELVASQEREACALTCVASELIDMPTRHEIAVVRKCAAAIRARAKEQTP
jgi:hypothetical protein